MLIRWTSKALSDLARLHEFLAPVNPSAAARAVRLLQAAPKRLLLKTPRVGPRLDAFSPREVRRRFVGGYENRYEILDDRVVILRLWRTREDLLS